MGYKANTILGALAIAVIGLSTLSAPALSAATVCTNPAFPVCATLNEQEEQQYLAIQQQSAHVRNVLSIAANVPEKEAIREHVRLSHQFLYEFVQAKAIGDQATAQQRLSMAQNEINIAENMLPRF